jgi:hypothetical protein
MIRVESSQEPGLALWRILGRRRKVAGGELVGRIECGGAISLVCDSGDLLRINSALYSAPQPTAMRVDAISYHLRGPISLS